AVAVVCMILAVQWSAYRADDVALHQERQLFAQAVADRRARVLRDIESIVTSDNAVMRLWTGFDREWGHKRAGPRLRTYFEHDDVFVVDPADHLVYALDGESRFELDPSDAAFAELAAVIDAVRGRPTPIAAVNIEPEATDPATGMRLPVRTTRVQTFM